MKYDVIIVGAGPAGIFAAYEIIEKTNKKVLLVDKGLDIYKRKCPILDGKITKCPEGKDGTCSPACSITDGFGGAGAFSDGKFNITNEFGGWLCEYLDDDVVLDLIKEVDRINTFHGATSEIMDPTTDKVLEIEKLGYSKGLKLLRSEVRHLGTEQNLMILKSIYEHLTIKCDMMFETQVDDVIVEYNRVKGIVINGEKYLSNNVILTPGRDGSKWLEKIMTKNKVTSRANQVDIGVRVETNDVIMKEINDNLYEGKFIFNTSIGTTVRTFCSNPSGHVVIENHSGTMLANGHAYKDKDKGSKNTNFALLVSHRFDENIKNPNEFAHSVSKLANQVTNGSIIVQKYGDIKMGRRSTEKRIQEGFVVPTQKTAVPGDLALVLPYATLKSIIEMVEALDVLTPGIASEHTLFYGVEAKFYSSRFEVNNRFETKVKGLYLGGDGAGFTRGLAQASANGLYIAKCIINDNNYK